MSLAQKKYEIYFHKNSVLNDAFAFGIREGGIVDEVLGDKGVQASTVQATLIPVGRLRKLAGTEDKMTRLRSTIDPEEQSNFVEGPTRNKVGLNQSELICGICGGTYYVDDATLEQSLLIMQQGLDNPFCCDDCQTDYEELSHESDS